jgi:hypothetical protein
MRPTDKLGTFNSTSGGVEEDADAAVEEIVVATTEDVGDAVVEGVMGDEVCEDVVKDVVAHMP